MNNQDKFAEPRGWALKWVFTDEMVHTTVEQEPRSYVGEKFAEPRGWALKWSGLALPLADAQMTFLPGNRSTT